MTTTETHEALLIFCLAAHWAIIRRAELEKFAAWFPNLFLFLVTGVDLEATQRDIDRDTLRLAELNEKFAEAPPKRRAA